jgi:hypothetical protein
MIANNVPNSPDKYISYLNNKKRGFAAPLNKYRIKNAFKKHIIKIQQILTKYKYTN